MCLGVSVGMGECTPIVERLREDCERHWPCLIVTGACHPSTTAPSATASPLNARPMLALDTDRYVWTG